MSRSWITAPKGLRHSISTLLSRSDRHRRIDSCRLRVICGGLTAGSCVTLQKPVVFRSMETATTTHHVNVLLLIIGSGFCGGLAFLSYRSRSLTRGGAIATAGIGVIVFGLCGLAWAVPILFFFVTSSILSRVTSPSKAKAMRSFDKTGARDSHQVLANGGVAAVAASLAVLTSWSGWYYVYLAAISEACADTWATEIGTMSRQRPISVVTFRRVEIGQSGGITAIGTLAAAVGSLMTALFGWIILALLDGQTSAMIGSVMIAATAGFLGALADSILGATVQAQYLNAVTGRITEKPKSSGLQNRLISGSAAINNDAVNFLSTAAAAGVALAVIMLLVF